MKQADRPSYPRVLATVMGLLSRRAPLPLITEVIVGLVLMGANVLVFFLLERVMAQVAGNGRPDELVVPILVVGAAIVLRELLEMLADPHAVYLGGKGASALTAALNEKAARLEIVEFETFTAHERLELAKQGVQAAVSMLLFFLFSANQLIFFVMAAGYLFSLSPLLALVIPLMFAPRIASHLIHGSRYYRLERKTVPLLREFQYLERCLVDREYFKETRVLGAGAHLLKRYRGAVGRFNAARWREDVRLGVIDLGLNVLVLAGYGGSFLLAALLLAGGSISVGGFAVVIYAVSREGGVPEELWQGPDGLDVMLSREFGTRELSLGQWQRLAIARGLFREHDTVLLDEPTASIDPLEEQAVYERSMKIAAGRTAIIVTHRLASARLADRILVLDDGRIVEDGTHEELLVHRGLYHRMFTAQAAWYRRN